MSPVPAWTRRAGMVGATAGALAASAALGAVAEKRTVGRRLRTVPEVAPPPYAEHRHETVVIADDGVPLHAEVDGPADAGRTVVLVHGWALSLECWWYQRRDLADAGRIVLYDQRGHGRSGRGGKERATIDQLGADLGRVLQELAPAGPVVLVGHSMGGMTIMSLAERHPELFGDRVVGVALCSTSPGKLAEVTFGVPARAGRLLRGVAPSVFGQLVRRPGLVERSRRVGSDLELLVTRRYAFASDVPASLVEFVSRMISTTPIETIADFYPAFDAHDKLAALDVLDGIETLVLAGEADMVTPADHSREIAAALPRAELVVVPAAGHLVMLEHPGTVTAHLRGLLERAPTSHPATGRHREAR